jgi:hypothetical protein
MEIDRAGRGGRDGEDAAQAEGRAAAPRPAGTPDADYPSVCPAGAGRGATE